MCRRLRAVSVLTAIEAQPRAAFTLACCLLAIVGVCGQCALMRK